MFKIYVQRCGRMDVSVRLYMMQIFVCKQGLAVGSAMIDGEMYLVAFGGYNGKYSNEVCKLFFFFNSFLY